MPISVRCPNCNAKLNAPDAAAGRRVKCPKCETKIPVPAATDGSAAAPAIATPTPAPPLPPTAPATQAGSASPFDFSSPEPAPVASPSVASPPAPPASAAPAFDFGAAAEAGAGKSPRGETRKPSRPVDEEEDDEDADEPPRRGGRRPPPRAPEGKKSGKPLVLILVAVGFVFLTCCVGLPIGLYLYMAPKIEEARQDFQKELDRAAQEAKSRETNAPSGTGNDKAPPGWQEYAAIDGSFKGYFPDHVQEESVEPIELPKIKAPVQVKMYQSLASDESVMVVLRVLHFDPATDAGLRGTLMRAHKSEVLKGHNATPKAESQRTISWLGQPATEAVHSIFGSEWTDGKLVVRDVIAGNTGYIVTIKGKTGRPGPAIENGFFDTFEATAK